MHLSQLPFLWLAHALSLPVVSALPVLCASGGASASLHGWARGDFRSWGKLNKKAYRNLFLLTLTSHSIACLYVTGKDEVAFFHVFGMKYLQIFYKLCHVHTENWFNTVVQPKYSVAREGKSKKFHETPCSIPCLGLSCLPVSRAHGWFLPLPLGTVPSLLHDLTLWYK